MHPYPQTIYPKGLERFAENGSQRSEAIVPKAAQERSSIGISQVRLLSAIIVEM